MYCAKCESLIKKLGMEDHVFIKGLAKPAEILRQGWIYLQVCPALHMRCKLDNACRNLAITPVYKQLGVQPGLSMTSVTRALRFC